MVKKNLLTYLLTPLVAAPKLMMNWPVKTKPWSICNAVGDSRSTNKLLFCKALQELDPSKSETSSPLSIDCYKSGKHDLNKFQRLQSRENTFFCWAERIAIYLNSSPGETINVLFENHGHR